MTTITQLYNNIKTLILQVFEDKTNEDNNLYNRVDPFFQYIKGKIYIKPLIPPLNGTDTIVKWTSGTNNTSNGIFTSHGSYLGEGWSNKGLWELDFDVKATSWWYIGMMPICSSEINPFTDAKNANYSLTTWEGFSYPGGLGLSSWESQDSFSKKTDTNWHHMNIKKLSSTKLQITLDYEYIAIGEFPNLANLTELHIGSRDNPSSRNSGGNVQYKNIIIDEG